MIACSYCGKENEPTATHCCGCGTELRPLPEPEVPPESPPDLPSPKFIAADALSPAFEFVDGFHRADWNVVQRWIESNVDVLNRNEAWSEAALLWVQKLRDDLGGNYFVVQSGQTILLCDRPLETARRLLDYSGKVAATIQGYLGKIAWSGGVGKDVVIIFSDQDDYYQYLAYHSLDGEQAASGGVCVHSGYTHVALPWGNDLEAANTIVHELTHDCLAHLPLPLWLNEGIAMTMQRIIAPSQGPLMWDELAERQFAFWNEENVQSFWAGTSFYEPGDPNELSYSLAEVLVKLLSEKSSGDSFRAFIEAANQTDAGQTAAMNILGADLGEIAGTFLGEGNWHPRRKAMVECWESAGWEKRSNDGESASVEDKDRSPN